MRKRYFIVGLAVAGVAALVIAAAGLAKVGSSKSASVLPASSCSSLQYGGSGSPQFIVASDLPLQGSSRAQTIEMTKAIAYTFKKAGYKAGKYTRRLPVLRRLDGTGREVGSGEVLGQRGQLRPRQVRDRRHRHLQLGLCRDRGADHEPCRPAADVSPANTYIGLTHKPALAGEPQKYYPTGKRTYARVVAADDFQGAADALQLKALKAKSIYILNDKEAYGFGIASAVQNVIKGSKLGLKVAGFQAWDPKASSYQDIATKIKASGADAVFLGGLECENGGKLIKDLRAGLGGRVPDRGSRRLQLLLVDDQGRGLGVERDVHLDRR